MSVNCSGGVKTQLVPNGIEAVAADSQCKLEALCPSECKLCKRAFKDLKPKLLPCLHTFCEDCIQQRHTATNSFVCPLDSQECKNINGIIDQYFVTDALFKAINRNSPNVGPCYADDCLNPAQGWCENCSDWLCEEDIKAHKRVKLTKEHSIISVADYQNAKHDPGNRVRYCSTHPSEAVQLYCEKCEQLTCRDCQLHNHQGHKHAFVNESAVKEKQSIRNHVAMIANKVEHIQVLMMQISTEKHSLKQTQEALKSQMTGFFDAVRLELANRERILTQDLQKTCDDKRDLLNKQENVYRKLLGIMEFARTFSLQAVQSDNSIALMHCKKPIVSQLKNIIKIPKSQFPSNIDANIKFSYDRKLCTEYLGNLGKIVDTSSQITTHSPSSTQIVTTTSPIDLRQNSPSSSVPTTCIRPTSATNARFPVRGPCPRPLNQQSQSYTSQRMPRGHVYQPRQRYNPRDMSAVRSNVKMSPATSVASMSNPPTSVHSNVNSMMRTQDPKMFDKNHHLLAQQTGQQMLAQQQRAVAAMNAQARYSSMHHPSRMQTPTLPPRASSLSPRTYSPRYPMATMPTISKVVGGVDPPSVSSSAGIPTVESSRSCYQPYSTAEQKLPQTPATKASTATLPQSLPSLVSSSNLPNPPKLQPSPHVVAAATGSVSTSNNISVQQAYQASDLLETTIVKKERTESSTDDCSSALSSNNKTPPLNQVHSTQSDLPAPPTPTEKIHIDINDQQTPISSSQQSTDNHEDYCAVCGDGGDLLCCDGCVKVYHLSHHVPTVPSLPTGTWICRLCTKTDYVPDSDSSRKRRASEFDPQELLVCQQLLLKLFTYSGSQQFHLPVPKDIEGYYDVVRNPMDFTTIKKRLCGDESQAPTYTIVTEFLRDCRIVFRNAKYFNGEQSVLGNLATDMEKYFEQQVVDMLGSHYITLLNAVEILSNDNSKRKKIK